MKFITTTNYEKWRVQTLLTKEPGTIAWLKANVRKGDVVYDIGANIGGYTLIAAELAGPEGLVVAFEPHIITAASLLRNVQKNGFTSRVRVMTCALSEREILRPFNYQHAEAGSSGSQLGSLLDENGKAFVPELEELKYATSVDALLAIGLRTPDVVKIDVDGNELAVLEGMERLLLLRNGLRSLQVEIHPSSSAVIVEYLSQFGFTEQSRHVSSLGQESIDRGCDPAKVFANAIFARAA